MYTSKLAPRNCQATLMPVTSSPYPQLAYTFMPKVFNLALCYNVLRRDVLCAMLCQCAALCFDTLFCAMLRYSVLCYAVLSYAVLYSVVKSTMLCCAMLF